MDILQTIKDRKLEMLKESQTLEQQKQVLSMQLNQVNAKVIELNAELKVLDKWESKLKEESKC